MRSATDTSTFIVQIKVQTYDSFFRYKRALEIASGWSEGSKQNEDRTLLMDKCKRVHVHAHVSLIMAYST